MHGFKSFANKTEIAFDKGINVIIGPNGSGKSNISDALCFVLGRLSSKSIRAAKAKNLMFMGSKYVKPAREATVEIVFDNTDRKFAIETDEIIITRSVRGNGMSIYKLNGETKTRAEILEVLAQAEIDAQGFNLVLQGQIQSIVRMHPEDRRKVIEEVAGISVYESRKARSLHELEKTEERLKEINAILRERTSFLRNLENERAQALKFKELELTVRRCKASLLQRKIADKEKEISSIKKSIEEKEAYKQKVRASAAKIEEETATINARIQEINKSIQRATGFEQESLRNEVGNLRAELEGLRVRKESYERREEELKKRLAELERSLPEYEREIHRLAKESPLVAKKREELSRKKAELAKIEEDRKKAYAYKTELISLKDRIRDKESLLARTAGESTVVLKQIEEYSVECTHKDAAACKKAYDEHEREIHQMTHEREKQSEAILTATREISKAEQEITSSEKVKSQILTIDICPLCRNAMTDQHRQHVMRDTNQIIDSARERIERNTILMKHAEERTQVIRTKLIDLEKHKTMAQRELSLHQLIQDKQTLLKRLVSQEQILKKEIIEFEQKRERAETLATDSSRIDELHAAKMMEIEEISSMDTQDLDRSLLMKQRDLEKAREIIKIITGDVEKIKADIREVSEKSAARSELLAEKEKAEKQLSEKFKQFFKERDALQLTLQESSFELSTKQSEARQVEDQINYLKIGFAKFDAEKQAIEMEMIDYGGVEPISASVTQLEERMHKAQESLRTIGSINMRALEVYDEIKSEYDRVQEKVNTLSKEKEDIMAIITEIDTKKKRSFMRTFKGINEIFSMNFAKLSTKGQAALVLENEEDIFAGGVSIVIKMMRGKHFDVTSLSGGEQTLVALSLLFAIQEYKPYHFYVFDEIDAALDKRNSERLSALLKQYMKSGQYITITHNDALILDASVLYGVSMHEGVSKILSLKLPSQ